MSNTKPPQPVDFQRVAGVFTVSCVEKKDAVQQLLCHNDLHGLQFFLLDNPKTPVKMLSLNLNQNCVKISAISASYIEYSSELNRWFLGFSRVIIFTAPISAAISFP